MLNRELVRKVTLIVSKHVGEYAMKIKCKDGFAVVWHSTRDI
jgi:hypothetical protein